VRLATSLSKTTVLPILQFSAGCAQFWYLYSFAAKHQQEIVCCGGVFYTIVHSFLAGSHSAGSLPFDVIYC
jgi:hypothetical protein